MSVETPGGMVMLWVISKSLPVIAGLVPGLGSGFGSGSGSGSSSPGAMVMSFSTTSHVDVYKRQSFAFVRGLQNVFLAACKPKKQAEYEYVSHCVSP